MSSIITVLKKVYKEGLEPKGFVQLKGRHPYFVRVIGGEIVQVITFRKEPGPVGLREENYEYAHPELGHFRIFGGIATVYRKKLDLSLALKYNLNWMLSHSEIYTRENKPNIDKDVSDSVYEYVYKKDDEHSMYEIAQRSLDMTYKILLSVFDKVNDVEDCIRYFEHFNSPCMNLSDKREYGWDDERFGTDPDSEALLYIYTKSNDDYKIQTKKACKNWYELCNSEKTGLTMEDYKKYCEEVEMSRMRKVTIRDRILFTENVYNNALKELERRKNNNLEGLRACGVKI